MGGISQHGGKPAPPAGAERSSALQPFSPSGGALHGVCCHGCKPQRKILSHRSQPSPSSYFNLVNYGRSLCSRRGNAEGRDMPGGRMPSVHGRLYENSFCITVRLSCSAVVARTGPRWNGCRPGARGRSHRKKRVSIFDQQSHYVIENKGSEKRTKPNKAKFGGWGNRRRGARAAACSLPP